MHIATILFSLLVGCAGSADADGDGARAADDCDDGDPSVAAIADDRDCDGAPTADDCDDTTGDLGALAEDADCDGALIADDCDDWRADLRAFADDADCDGSLTADDCDDQRSGIGAVADDADCDGTPTTDDCNDGDASIYDLAGELCDGIDQDCDGFVDDGFTTAWSVGGSPILFSLPWVPPVDDVDWSVFAADGVRPDADTQGIVHMDAKDRVVSVSSWRPSDEGTDSTRRERYEVEWGAFGATRVVWGRSSQPGRAPGEDVEVVFTYDDFGRNIERAVIQDGETERTYTTYDRTGRATLIETSVNGGPRELVTSWVFGDHRSVETYPDTESAKMFEEVRTLNDDGDIVEFTRGWVGKPVAYREAVIYDAEGRITWLGRSLDGDTTWEREYQSEYDEAGHLIRYAHEYDGDGDFDDYLRLSTYHPSGALLTRWEDRDGDGSPEFTIDNEVDAEGRLVSGVEEDYAAPYTATLTVRYEGDVHTYRTEYESDSTHAGIDRVSEVEYDSKRTRHVWDDWDNDGVWDRIYERRYCTPDEDSDGVMAWDDCDDNDVAAPVRAEDFDCDGAANGDDCDNIDPVVGTCD
jgi:hypothetical protein